MIRFEQPVSTQDVRSSLEAGFEGASLSVITIGSENQVRVSTNYKINEDYEDLDAEITNLLFTGLKTYLPENVDVESFTENHIVSSQKVGPTIASDIKISAIWAVAVSLLIIGLYILLRFRNVAFSVGVIASLLFAAVFIFGLYSLLYSIMPFSLEIDQTFIAAILTVIGYAVNDSVVVFDRIREMIGIYPKRHKRLTMNSAMNTTLLRTFSTSLSTALVLLAILLFGGDTIRGFSFAMLVGVITGTFGTLFVASPIAYDIQRKMEKFSDKVTEETEEK